MGLKQSSGIFAGVLIISSLNEPCTQWVTKELDALGADYLLVNYEEAVLQRNWSIHIEPGRDADLYSRTIDKAVIGPSGGINPKAVWMRRWGYPIFPSSFDEATTAFSFGEISSVIGALPELFPAARWVNPQANERRASNKIFQLQMASRVGFPTPRTLVSSDADEIRAFWADNGAIIFKPVSGFQPMVRRINMAAREKYASNNEDSGLGFGAAKPMDLIFTQELTDDKAALLSTIQWAPAIFQQKIEKMADVRITVVGQTIFACRIFSQARDDTKLDFRVMNITGLLRHEIFELPLSFEHQVLAYMNSLGLVFGCLDFVEDPDGRLHFLEVNPAGQWLWIEQATGAPISRAMASYLASS